jgi:hypothetical protein
MRMYTMELVYGWKMVLTFYGRKDEDVYNGDLNKLYGLVATTLQSLVTKVSKKFSLIFSSWFHF